MYSIDRNITWYMYIYIYIHNDILYIYTVSTNNINDMCTSVNVDGGRYFVFSR